MRWTPHAACLLLGALVALGGVACSKAPAGESPAKGAASSAAKGGAALAAASPAGEEEQPVAGGLEPSKPDGELIKAANELQVRTRLQKAGRKLQATELELSDEQLSRTGATAAHAYKVDGTPMRVLVLDYPDPKTAAKAIVDVVVWVNGSGIIHNAEASGARSRVILVGSATAEPLTDAQKGIIDEYMNAFLGH